MPQCECTVYIFEHVPVADLVGLIREYVAEMDVDKLNAAIARTRTYNFHHHDLSGQILAIRYVDDELKFGRSDRSMHNLWEVNVCCNIENVPFILQDSNILDVIGYKFICENLKLKDYLVRLGSRLDKIMRLCHAESSDYEI